MFYKFKFSSASSLNLIKATANVILFSQKQQNIFQFLCKFQHC